MTSRTRLTLLLSALACVIVGAVWAWFLKVQVDQYRPRIIRFLQNATDRPVTIEKVSLSLARGLLLDVAGLEIRSKNPDNPPLLTTKHLLLGVGFDFLFSDRLNLSSITFISPHFNFVRYSDGLPFIEQAQRIAKAADKALKRRTGSGLSEIRIGRVTVRDGSVNMADWGNEDSQTVVFDAFQANLYHVAPGLPSPVTATARVHGVPFKMNGQVGPIPSAIDPLAIPMLLSFEAKTIDFASMADLLPPSMAGTERGYFSALIHGSLAEGLATSSWLEVENFTVPGQQGQVAPFNITLRQKSLFQLGKDQHNLTIEELFFYINNSPVLQVGGGLSFEPLRLVDLTIKTVSSITMDQFKLPKMGTLHGPVSGNLQISGTPLGDFRIRGTADLTKATWTWPTIALNKQSGTPMLVLPEIERKDNRWRINELTIQGADPEKNYVQVAGTVIPDLALTVNGEWPLDRLGDFLPMARQWPLKGELRWGSRLQQKEGGTAQWQGEAAVAQGLIGDEKLINFSTAFDWNGKELLFSPWLMALTTGGVIEGSLHITPSERNYWASMAVTGLPLTALPDAASGPLYKRLNGLLQAEGDMFGTLTDNYLLEPPQSGRLHVVMEPGGLSGVGNGFLMQRPTTEISLSETEKTFYWERGSAELNWTAAGVRINDLNLDTGKTKITGSGWAGQDQGLDLLLQIDTPWQPNTPPLWAQLFGSLDDLRLKPTAGPGE